MKKFLLKLLMGASLTTSVFIFQACYGCPPVDEVYDIPRIETETVSGDEGQEIEEIADEEAQDTNPACP